MARRSLRSKRNIVDKNTEEVLRNRNRRINKNDKSKDQDHCKICGFKVSNKLFLKMHLKFEHENDEDSCDVN